MTIESVDGFGAVGVASDTSNFLLRAQIIPGSLVSSYGIRFGAGEKMRGGVELRVEPTKGKIGLRPAETSLAVELESSAIYEVAALDRPFELELLVSNDIVDVCVDGRRTLVARLAPSTGGRVFLFAQSGRVSFERIELRPVADRHGGTMGPPK